MKFKGIVKRTKYGALMFFEDDDAIKNSDVFWQTDGELFLSDLENECEREVEIILTENKNGKYIAYKDSGYSTITSQDEIVSYFEDEVGLIHYTPNCKEETYFELPIEIKKEIIKVDIQITNLGE